VSVGVSGFGSVVSDRLSGLSFDKRVIPNNAPPIVRKANVKLEYNSKCANIVYGKQIQLTTTIRNPHNKCISDLPELSLNISLKENFEMSG
jgi:hypothetical protein